MKTKANFEQALRHYFAKEFVEAAGCFKQVLGVNPNDKTARLYLERSACLSQCAGALLRFGTLC